MDVLGLNGLQLFLWSGANSAPVGGMLVAGDDGAEHQREQPHPALQ